MERTGLCAECAEPPVPATGAGVTTTLGRRSRWLDIATVQP